MSRIIFITGTDTGVGKTVLTALLLIYLRQNKSGRTVAIKPFCSGGREDIELLQSIQGRELPDDVVNPFYFDQPVAPAAQPGKHRSLSVKNIVTKIREVACATDILLVEGAGGLRVPLSNSCDILDVISALKCEVILVGRNGLGTLNHTFLSMDALKRRGLSKIKIALMEQPSPDASSSTNARILRSRLTQTPVIKIHRIAENPNKAEVLKCAVKKYKKSLARLVTDH